VSLTCVRERVGELGCEVLVGETRVLWLRFCSLLRMNGLLQELVGRQGFIVRVLMAYELDLGSWCSECVVVDEVVGLLVDLVVVAGSRPRVNCWFE